MVKPLPAWFTPDSAWKGFQSQRFTGNMPNGQYAQDAYTYVTPSPALASLAPAATAILDFQTEADSSFQLEAITCTNIAASLAQLGGQQISMQLYDGGPHKHLFNILTPVNNVTGIGALPHILPVPKIFPANQLIGLGVKNYDTAITFTNLQFALLGKKIFNDQRNQQGSAPRFNQWLGWDGKTYWDDYFAYTFNLASIAAGVTTPVTILLDGDSDFEWITGAACASPRGTTTGVATNSVNCSVQIFDGASQRNLLSNPAPMATVFGLGILPIINPMPRIFTGATPVTISVTNNDAVTISNIFITMEGRKVYCASN